MPGPNLHLGASDKPTSIGGSDALRYAPELQEWDEDQVRIMNMAIQSVRSFESKNRVAPNHFLMSADFYYTMLRNPRAQNPMGGIRFMAGLPVLVCNEMKSEVVACLC